MTMRKRTALDWMAVAAEEHGREILEVYLEPMRGGDWRAAEALRSRIYGKPTDTVVTHTTPSQDTCEPEPSAKPPWTRTKANAGYQLT
jgi:hypothetical protein